MPHETQATDSAPATSIAKLGPLLGLALVATMAVAITGYALRPAPLRSVGDCYEQEVPPGEDDTPFVKWKKPDLALVISGQMHGYYDPCGCSDPQYGGLTRRYNFIQALRKDKGWDVVGIDLGDLPGLKGIREQNLLKYMLGLEALATMNYRAVGIGLDDMMLPLADGLARAWNKDQPHPRPISMSLADAADGKALHQLNVRHHEIVKDTNPKVGVLSMMGPDLRDDALLAGEKFLNTLQELPKALDKFAAEGVEFGIILHHEHPNVKLPPGLARALAIEKHRKQAALKCAQFCADYRKNTNKKAPMIHLVMLLTDEPEPPFFLSDLDSKLPTKLAIIGHKGEYVGLVGIYRDKAKDFRLQYQIVKMSPEWATRPGQEANHPVTALIQRYNQELKREDMLGKVQRNLHFNQIPPQGQNGLAATFVGSAKCGACHSAARKVWKSSPHYEATDTLEKEKSPSGRHFDPECMMCHTTGLKHPGGYYDLVVNPDKWPAKPAKAPTQQDILDHNEKLRGVGCESCHGPGSAHVEAETKTLAGREKLYERINPYRPTDAELRLEAKAANKKITAVEQAMLRQLFDDRMRPMAQNLCLKCHDLENDVHWGKEGKTTADKWLRLIHRSAGPLPAKAGKLDNANPGVVDPPIVIEIIQEKK